MRVPVEHQGDATIKDTKMTTNVRVPVEDNNTRGRVPGEVWCEVGEEVFVRILHRDLPSFCVLGEDGVTVGRHKR